MLKVTNKNKTLMWMCSKVAEKVIWISFMHYYKSLLLALKMLLRATKALEKAQKNIFFKET